MIHKFALTSSSRERVQPLPFAAEDYLDATPLFVALERWLTEYQGIFTLWLDDMPSPP